MICVFLSSDAGVPPDNRLYTVWASHLLLLRGSPPAGSGGSFPRRLFAAFHDPFTTTYPQTSEKQREPRVQNAMAASVEAGMEGGGSPAASACPLGYASASGCEGATTSSPLGPPPLGSNMYDSSQAFHGPYGQYTVGETGALPAGLQESAYGGGLPYTYGPPVASLHPYRAASFYAPPGLAGGVGYYSPMGGWAVQQGAPSLQSSGAPCPFPAPSLQQHQTQGPWPQGAGGAPSWGSQEAHGGSPRANALGNEGAGPSPPALSARERQRQFLSAAVLGELDALEAKRSILTYLEGLNGGKLAGRMGPKEWLYTTNVLSDLLRSESHEQADFGALLLQQLLVLQQLRQLLRGGRSSFLPHDVALLAANASRVQALFSMHFLSREAGKKAADALAHPSASLREALRAATAAGREGAAETQGPVFLSAYKTACDELVAEVVFCCAKKVEEYPASTQPSYVRSLPTIMRAAPAQLLPRDNHQHHHQQQQSGAAYTVKGVKAVWTEVVARVCPLLGRFEFIQLLQILQGASALANRKIIRDNDLLTLAQAAGALLEQDRFVAEVPEAQRCRMLHDFFKWCLDTCAPFAFVRHVAWKATRLFKLNLRWLSSNETAKLLPLICANRVLLSEDELSFFVQVLLKRVSRSTPLYAEAQKLNADSAAAALFGVAINGVDPQRFSGLISHLLQEAAALEELPRSQSIVFARLCWALCALRAFDPTVAAGSWSAAEAAALLQSALKRVEVDNVASLALLPEVLTEIKLSAEVLPNFEVPAAVQAAAAEASRVQAAVDRRQSRRLHFTFRRALEKLGAHVQPAFSFEQKIELVENDGSKLEQENSVSVEEEAAGLHASPQTKGSPAGSVADGAEQWFFNQELGPYNVSFYCPAKQRLQILLFDAASKYVKKRQLEKLFEADGLRVLVVGEHLFQLSRVTGEQGSDLLRSAINASTGSEDVCPPRHVQLQALLKSFPRQRSKAGGDEEVSATTAEASDK
ncbi:hypothetical protein Esti_001991 [Eimeria stiedai]